MQSLKLYEQLVQSIKQKIIDGEYQIGSQIESERSMSEKYGINRMTVRKALKKLEGEGCIKCQSSVGYFVSNQPKIDEKIELGQDTELSLSRQIRQKGMKSSRVMLSFQKIKATGEVKDYFPDTEYIYEIVRLSLINDKPFAIQKVNLPCNLFTEAERFDFVEESLYSYMADQGHKPASTISDLKIAPITDEYYEILGIPKGKEVFMFTYLTFDKDHILVEYTNSYNLPEYTSFTYRGVTKN